MSFFDEGDESRRPPSPRRPTAVAVDAQTVRTRQAVAAGVGLLVFILLALGVKGCLDSSRKRGLRDYTRAVGELVETSDSQVGARFFEALSGAGGAENALNLENRVNGLRFESAEIVKRARRLEVPEAMRAAQEPLLLALEMRRDAMEKIADKLSTAQGSGAEKDEAIVQITGQMQLFYASDLIYEYRVGPAIGQALANADVDGTSVPQTDFFKSIEWLNAGEVAERLGATLSASRRGGPVAPGSHGHAVSSVTVSGVTLTPDAANRIPAGQNLTFTVKLQNQGENDEAGVVVKLTIEGSGSPITAQSTISQTIKGSEASVDIPLRQAPPPETALEVNVSVDPVPGEKVTDNNRESYAVFFTR